MNTTKLVDIINREFGSPLLPEGQVEARIRGDHSFCLRINGREVVINDHEVISASGGCTHPDPEVTRAPIF